MTYLNISADILTDKSDIFKYQFWIDTHQYIVPVWMDIIDTNRANSKVGFHMLSNVEILNSDDLKGDIRTKWLSVTA